MSMYYVYWLVSVRNAMAATLFLTLIRRLFLAFLGQFGSCSGGLRSCSGGLRSILI
jgi:hypothetical protein